MNPCINEPTQRPSLALLSAEPIRAALELAHHRLATSRPETTGDGHPVVIFPGFGAGAASLTTLRDHCRALGHPTMDWGQGVNTAAP